MMESKYLSRFKRLSKEEYKDLIVLTGNTLLVEVIKEEEIKTASGIVMAQVSSYKMTAHDKKATFVRVLVAGAGFYDDVTKEPIPLDCEQGDILLVPKDSITLYSVFGGLAKYEQDTIGVTSEGAIIARIPNGLEGYNKLFAVLNEPEVAGQT